VPEQTAKVAPEKSEGAPTWSQCTWLRTARWISVVGSKPPHQKLVAQSGSIDKGLALGNVLPLGQSVSPEVALDAEVEQGVSVRWMAAEEAEGGDGIAPGRVGVGDEEPLLEGEVAAVAGGDSGRDSSEGTARVRVEGRQRRSECPPTSLARG